MRILQLDGSAWKKPLDFYQALFDAIEQGYPHGMNINAFIDSMIWRGMGGIEPPYKIEVVHLAHVPEEVREEVLVMIAALKEARQDRIKSWGDDVEVSMVAPGLPQ